MIQQESIKAIDIYVRHDYAMADISILRNEIFYCFGTEDMREDGHISIDEAKGAAIFSEIAELIEREPLSPAPEDTLFRLAITLGNDSCINHSGSKLGSKEIRKILETLSDRFDEFMFLDTFTCARNCE